MVLVKIIVVIIAQVKIWAKRLRIQKGRTSMMKNNNTTKNKRDCVNNFCNSINNKSTGGSKGVILSAENDSVYYKSNRCHLRIERDLKPAHMKTGYDSKQTNYSPGHLRDAVDEEIDIIIKIAKAHGIAKEDFHYFMKKILSDGLSSIPLEHQFCMSILR